MIIDGRKIAKEIIDRLQKYLIPKRFIGVILVGENIVSTKFIQQKKKIAEILNIDFRIYSFSESVKVDELRKKIGIIARGKTCGGLIVQLPLPSCLDRRRILNSIPKEKDLDVLSESAYEQFLTDQKVLPPSVSTFCEILPGLCNSNEGGLRHKIFENVLCETKNYQADRFVVVGNGFLIGKPISDYLRLCGKQLIVIDKEDDLLKIKDADVVILGTGVPGIVNERMIKNGALIVDFGCSFIDGELCGDLLKPTIKNQQSTTFLYTPTPGGTGPILVAKLFENFYKLNAIDRKII